MATGRQDFERFTRWLHQPEKAVPSNVRKLANLILLNFDAVAGTSRNRSQRSVYLSSLIRRELITTPDIEPAAVPEVGERSWPWRRLKHLTLGPFRGFREAEPFDISKNIILFYGPNGSGKTSLCEGLEYAMLGDVEEAGTKRIAARTYLTNVHDNRFEPPTLIAISHDGQDVNVIANLDNYRFCFIERNRIDAFSRIAAKPNGQRAELIATLFGMEQFSDFVSHFNESIDGQLILSAEKKASLDAYKVNLAIDQNFVESAVAVMQTLADEEVIIACEYQENLTYEELKRLIGSEVEHGRLHELNTILEILPPTIIGLTKQKLLEYFEVADQSIRALNVTNAELQEKQTKLSFQALYNAVLALQKFEGDHCPACDTPLNRVQIDPFEKARIGLEQLKDLASLQEKQQVELKALNRASHNLRKMLEAISNFITSKSEDINEIGQYLKQLPEEPEGYWWADLFLVNEAIRFENRLLKQLIEIVEEITAQDELSKQVEYERQPHIVERQNLIEAQLKVQAHEIRRRQFMDNLSSAQRRIEMFDETNAELIELVAQEASDIQRDTIYKATYDEFLEELKNYRAQLPGQLMTGLNEIAMDFYNSFNRNDREEDKLSALYLPLDGDGKIEICFRGNSNNRVDALHMLSEGHIRCLGLAILLAKAKELECPVIVFDDAINAIDHDHRGGIRETIFESDTFSQTQLIVTCHSNEFIKDIQQHLPVPRRTECKVYLLRHHNGNYQPRVNGNIASANYIARARSARDLLNDRDALSASRQALEMVCNKIWRWLVSHDQGVLNLMIVGVDAEPILRNLCDAISKKLRTTTTFNHPNKQIIQEAYGQILGIPENNLIWTYLNKGVHEEAERDDFDGEFVELVVQALERIDNLDLRERR